MEYVRRNLLLMTIVIPKYTQCNLVNSLKFEFFEWDMYCLIIFKSLGDY